MHVGLARDRHDTGVGHVILQDEVKVLINFPETKQYPNGPKLRRTVFGNAPCTDKDRRAARVCMNSQLHD
jgi:hypothetical protein